MIANVSKAISGVVCILAALMVCCMAVLPAHAASGAYDVVYEGNAGQLVSAEDDFFAHFDVMMPGDELTGTVTVSNDGGAAQDVWFFTRPMDAANRVEADLLLDEIELSIWSQKTGEVIYEGGLRAEGLNDPVHLGMFDSGDKEVLNFRLYVPAELGNEFAMAENAVNWVFAAEDAVVPAKDAKAVGEDPAGENQPRGGLFHKTGDDPAMMAAALTCGAFASCFAAVALLMVVRRKQRK